MDISEFAVQHNLKTHKFRGEEVIRGREGYICPIEDEDDLGVELTDQSLVSANPGTGLIAILIFDPTVPLQARLALDVIEASGHTCLTVEQRRKKLNLLRQVRLAQADECGLTVV